MIENKISKSNSNLDKKWNTCLLEEKKLKEKISLLKLEYNREINLLKQEEIKLSKIEAKEPRKAIEWMYKERRDLYEEAFDGSAVLASFNQEIKKMKNTLEKEGGKIEENFNYLEKLKRDLAQKHLDCNKIKSEIDIIERKKKQYLIEQKKKREILQKSYLGGLKTLMKERKKLLKKLYRKDTKVSKDFKLPPGAVKLLQVRKRLRKVQKQHSKLKKLLKKN